MKTIDNIDPVVVGGYYDPYGIDSVPPLVTSPDWFAVEKQYKGTSEFSTAVDKDGKPIVASPAGKEDVKKSGSPLAIVLIVLGVIWFLMSGKIKI